MSLNKVTILEKIVELNSLMNQTTDFKDLLNVILRETEKIFDIEGASILLEDKKTEELYFYITTGKKKNILKTIKINKGEGICGHVYKTGEILIENNPGKSILFSDKVDKKSKFVTKNLLSVPLKIKENRIGVIELVNKKNGNFNKRDVKFLTAIASQISITLERARLVKEKINSERLAAIGETVAGLSHFIKNIVNGLRGGSFIINKYIDKIESQKIKTGWKMVQKNINKISSLVMDMLLYSKDRKPEYKIVSIKSIINDVIELEKTKAKLHNIKFINEFSDDINQIKLDPNGIFRAILNIVNNSIDALKKQEQGYIKITTRKDNEGYVIIKIKDNGCGIKEEMQDNLFTKFFSTKGSKGSGFGLPITKKIIEEHQGRIQCNSEANKGTEFIIKLPST